MARRRKGEPPRYRLHKQSGQAVVSLPLGGGRYKDVLLGPYGSPESHRDYARIISEWRVTGATSCQILRSSQDITVAEVCLRFWSHAKEYYRRPDGTPSHEIKNIQYSLEVLQELYGKTNANQFGPLALKAVRQVMISSGKLCRRIINGRIDRLKRVFRWAVSEELVQPSVYEGLRSVTGLRFGQNGTHDHPPVRPVSPESVAAVLPYLRPQVAAMVQLQQLIGARSEEMCLMRSGLVERTGKVWFYKIDPNERSAEGTVNSHKTAHHSGLNGTARIKLLPIGPKAQKVLEPWLRENPDEFLFQPAEARKQQNAVRRQNRRSPMTPSQRARTPKRNAKRVPKERYDRHSYARAIARACEKAGVPHWHPHQLKHSCGTEVRRRFGLEAAKTYLGHSQISTTEIYAEKDLNMMIKIARKMG